MPSLWLVPVGNISWNLAEAIRNFLAQRLGVGCEVAKAVLDPFPAFDHGRSQYDARRLLEMISEQAEQLGAPALGITDVDLFSAIFTFVIGEAQLAGKAGIFSLHRLHPSVYGLPEDKALVLARAKKEALHEAGHLMGLIHCRQPHCVMHFCAIVEEVDLKTDQLCPACQAHVDDLRSSAS